MSLKPAQHELSRAICGLRDALLVNGVNGEVRVLLTREDWLKLRGRMPFEWITTETDGQQIMLDGVVVRGSRHMTDLLAATRDFHTALKAAGVNSEVRVTLTRADWWALCGCVPREFVSTETDGPRITMDGVVVRGI